MPQDAGRFGQGVIAFVAIGDQIHCPVWRIFCFRVEKFLGHIAATAVRILVSFGIIILGVEKWMIEEPSLVTGVTIKTCPESHSRTVTRQQ
jgi:hypothetical protein